MQTTQNNKKIFDIVLNKVNAVNNLPFIIYAVYIFCSLSVKTSSYWD